MIERFVRQNSHSKSQPTDTILMSTVHIPQQPSNGQVNISQLVPVKKSVSPNKGSPVKGSVCSPNSPYSGMSNFSNISIRMPDYEKKVTENEESLKDIRVGRKLSEQTTKRVSILALVLIFVVPCLIQATIMTRTGCTLSYEGNRKTIRNNPYQLYFNWRLLWRLHFELQKWWPAA